jgi:muramoyltetrapeptide carboxypeptidase
MLIPPKLQKGDTIIILAPANAVQIDEISIAVQLFKDWGLQVKFGKNLFNTYHTFAGTDEQRLEDLQNALNDTTIKAIICARGGYGTTRIIDKLDFATFLKFPKWVVGFSDITILHAKLQILKIASIHGSMPLLFPKQTQQSIFSLKKALFDEPVEINTNSHQFNKNGFAQGVLVGGNLSLWVNSLQTNTEIDTTNKILFLEDVNEYVYHLDRMLVHLYRAGKLKNLAGLILGQFSETKDNLKSFGVSVEKTIAEWTKEFSYPIAFDFPIGHHSDNWSLVCGKEVILEVNQEKSTLKYQ